MVLLYYYDGNYETGSVTRFNRYLYINEIRGVFGLLTNINRSKVSTILSPTLR